MRQILTTVYALDEIPDKIARQNAINELRNDLIASQAEEIYCVVERLETELSRWAFVNKKELEDTANKVGWCWGFDVVDNYIERTRMHGMRSTRYVMAALTKEADKIVRHFDNNPEEAYLDEDVIELANDNEYEFREDGKLICGKLICGKLI